MRSAYIVAAVALVTGVILIEAVVYTLVVGSPTAPTTFSKVDLMVNITGGETGAKYGFSLGNSLSSPGPDIVLKLGKIVQINFQNRGQIPHTLKVTKELKWDDDPVFGSVIGSPSRPLSPGQSGISTFRADRSGSYFYVCSIPGHIQLGMYGRLIVEP